jgi:hypothetical protein
MTWLRSAPRRIAAPPATGWRGEGPLRWTARDRRGALLGMVERVAGEYVPMDASGALLAPCPTLAAAQAALAPAPAAPERGDWGPLVMRLAGLAGAGAVLAAVADIVVRSL